MGSYQVSRHRVAAALGGGEVGWGGSGRGTLTVVVVPTGCVACGELALSLVLIRAQTAKSPDELGGEGWIGPGNGPGKVREIDVKVREAGINKRDADRVSLSPGWGGLSQTKTMDMVPGGGGLGAVGEEADLEAICLEGRPGECLAAAVEAVQIAFPHETSAGNADVAQNAGNDARAHAARAAGTAATAPEASSQTPVVPAQSASFVPAPPKRQRSAGQGRPGSRGLGAGGRAGGDGAAKTGGVQTESSGRDPARAVGNAHGVLDSECGVGGSGIAKDGGEEGQGSSGEGGWGVGGGSRHIFSLSQPLILSQSSEGVVADRAGGGDAMGDGERGREDEPFEFEVGGRASQLRATLRSSARDTEAGSESGVRESGGWGGGGASAGAKGTASAMSASGRGRRSDVLRSSKLYTELGFATPRKQEPASDTTDPYSFVDLYKGTPDKAPLDLKGGNDSGLLGNAAEAPSMARGPVERRNGMEGIQEHTYADSPGRPLSLDMLLGGGADSGEGGQLGSQGRGGQGEDGPGIQEGLGEAGVPSPASNLSNTLDGMAL